ncbi:MAG: serine hydrolase [Bacteroidales bacterium]|nr:serine hydrolase [Bacteroidales bacterium]
MKTNSWPENSAENIGHKDLKSIYYNSNLQSVYKRALKDSIVKLVYRYPSVKMQSFTEQLYSKYRFNGSVLVAQNGILLFKDHIGYTDPHSSTPIGENNTFQLASLSKQFTAAAIMLLYQEGKLDYDDKIADYLPNFPYKRISIRHLLNHVSGLPNYMWVAEHKWEESKPPDNEEMLELMSKLNLKLYFEPGLKFDYSNTGYFVLASLVEKISEMELALFLERYFYSPLSMHQTYVHSFSLDKNYENELIGYRKVGSRYRSIPFTVNDGVVGDKGVFSTVEDLFKWDRSLKENTILVDSVLKDAFSFGKTKKSEKVPYGFGFRLKDQKQGKEIYHNGVWNGFNNTFRKYTDDSITVIILSNNNFKAISSVSNKLKKLSVNYKEYDRLITVLENTTVYSDIKFESKSIRSTDIPYYQSAEILKKIAELHYKQGNPFLALKYYEILNLFLIGEQYKAS